MLVKLTDYTDITSVLCTGIIQISVQCFFVFKLYTGFHANIHVKVVVIVT